ncbi:hypothetical protein IWW48_001963 [Coemansia sp. RSA 1200]|nr:hypothetical protein IWW48_001963 [Coemansia sp. RSA 1200]
MERGGVVTSSPAAHSARGLEGFEEEEEEREQLVWDRIPMQRNSESAMSIEWAESEAGADTDNDNDDGAQPSSRQPPQLQRARSAECTSSAAASAAGMAVKRQRLAHAASEGEVDDDFAERQRPAPPPPVPIPAVPMAPVPITQQQAEAEDERSTCPVCMERWTAGGATRVVSLRCGHLFCKRCIARWMRRAAQTRRRARCPECAQTIGKGEVRPIYARSISAVDGEQLQRAQDESRRLAERAAELEVQLRMLETRYAAMCANSSRLGAELAETAERAAWLEAENTALAAQLAEKSGAGSCNADGNDNDGNADDAGSSSDYRPVVRLRATHRSPAAEGAMRRLALHPHTHTAYATYTHRAQGLHTLAQIDIHETRAAPLVLPSLHTAEIRAAEPSPHAAAPHYMLTASTDRSALVVSLDGAPTIAARLPLTAPAWSCAWDPVVPTLCYVGAARGLVTAFDLRNPARPLHMWDGPRHGSAAVDFSPVGSIAAVPCGSGSTRLVVANAAHAYALPPPDADAASWLQLTPSPDAADHTRRACFALSYDAALGCVAASFRSAASLVHELYAVGFDAATLALAPATWRLRQRLTVASRQTMWARPALFSYVDAQRVRRGLFCAGVEASRSLRAWDAGVVGPAAPRVLLDLPHDAGPAGGPVLDARGFQWSSGSSDPTVLATLTQSAIRIYDVR